MVLVMMMQVVMMVMMKTVTRQNFQSSALQANRVGNAGAEADGGHGGDDDDFGEYHDVMTLRHNFQINCSCRQSSGRCWSKSKSRLPIGRGWKTNETLPISRRRSTITLHFIQKIPYVANVVNIRIPIDYFSSRTSLFN